MPTPARASPAHEGGASGKISWHDFRYLYLSAEVGLFKNFSLVLNPTWLYGLEGPKDDFEKNVGPSDAWVGFKYQVHKGSTPMAIAFNHRTPYFYDLPGAYSRTLFDSAGRARGVSPEWRGLLKRDYTFSYVASRSLFRSKKQWAAEIGYNQWVWGRSARRYKEPFVSVGRSF